MLNLSTKTKLKPEEIIKKAKAFFGKEHGLEFEECEDPYSFDFKSSLGCVSITIEAIEGVCEVNMVTKEFDYQVRQFGVMIK